MSATSPSETTCPSKLDKLLPGTRVHLKGLVEGGRGAVLGTHTVPPVELPPHSQLLRASLAEQPHFVLVRFDLGMRLWVPLPNLKALPKTPDRYEQLRADPWQLVRRAEADGRLAALQYLLPLSCAGYHHHGERLVAALLQPLPLAEAVQLVQQLLGPEPLAEAVLEEPIVLPEADRPHAFDRSGWKRHDWQGYLAHVVDSLVRGLFDRFELDLDPDQPRDPDALAALATVEARQLAGVTEWFVESSKKMVRQRLLTPQPRNYLFTYDPRPAFPDACRLFTGIGY